MPISLPPIPPLQASVVGQVSVGGHQGSAAYADGTSASGKAPSPLPNEIKDSVEGDHVTLTAAGKAKVNAPDFAPVYAEIWKNGMKIAEIDIHGAVSSVNNLVTSAQGTVGSGGAILAARRAAEIARSIGGEIRVGGQIMDSQTLEMRAKLTKAYLS